MSMQPNILLICVDHWSASLLGCAGHPAIQTPTLDDLARNGVRFSNAYSESPVCIPARRTLMTGTMPATHGDRVFKDKLPMPGGVPTMAQTFRDAGYQAYAVGKLHVYPQRNRIGFDDVILDEEGRTQYGVLDDYEIFLGDLGYVGRQYEHGMSNNQYAMRAWHLPEETHATNWATQQMARTIKRRDPDKPGFWYVSYRHPHPPLVPLQSYLDLYRDMPIDEPFMGEWLSEPGNLPFCLQSAYSLGDKYNALQIRQARRAFYALCTHIDHQIRLLIGTLREEDLLDNTVICFTCDHGDMLGNQHMWAKRLFYENSAGIPMILLGVNGDERVGFNRIDDRLVGLQDVMPTLLDLAGIEIPHSVEGISMLSDNKRDWFYGEVGEDASATRMVHDGRFKLIYYPVGNHRQLFDLQNDPRELNDLAADSANTGVLAHLSDILINRLYGGDEAWVQAGDLVGLPAQRFKPTPNRGLSSQRGLHWPLPPKTDMVQFEWLQNDEDEI